MNLVTENYSYNTSGKTALRDSFVNDSTASVPSPYAKMFVHINRYDYTQSRKSKNIDFDLHVNDEESFSELNKKMVSNYLDAFEFDNIIIKPEQVRDFLIRNKTIISKLNKLVTLALSEYQDFIQDISLRVLGDESGEQEYLFIEFNLNDEVDIDGSIEIDDYFKRANPNLADDKISFDFV